MNHRCSNCGIFFNSQNPACTPDGDTLCWDCSPYDISGNLKHEDADYSNWWRDEDDNDNSGE